MLTFFILAFYLLTVINIFTTRAHLQHSITLNNW